jgi:hypothetical protein
MTDSKIVWYVKVYGIPRTKKTSNQGVVVRTKTGKQRAVMFPAAEWRAWVKEARITIDEEPFVSVKNSVPRLVHSPDGASLWTPLAYPLNCCATFYLGARQHGDTVGYMQGLADLLEQRQVIENDRYLATWDGTRLVHDGSAPRVELTLTPVSFTLE